MEGTDICFAPVLDLDEARVHPHNIARKTFVEVDGLSQPAPAPRFDRTPTDTPSGAPEVGQHTDKLLAEAGYSGQEISELRQSGAVG